MCQGVFFDESNAPVKADHFDSTHRVPSLFGYNNREPLQGHDAA